MLDGEAAAVGLKILDRYILKEMAGPFFIGLAVYSFIFLINLLFQLAGLMIQQGFSAGLSAVLFALSLPSLLAYTIPVALLLGTIIAYSRLSSDSEIIALRAGGIRAGKMLRPPLLFGAAATAVLLVFNLWLIPYARTAAESLQADSAEASNLVRLLRPGVFFDRVPGVLLYAQRLDEKAGRYDRVLVFQRPQPSVDVLTLAEHGRTVYSSDGKSLQFLLEDGQTVQFDRKNPGKIQTADFAVQTLTVSAAAPDSGPPSRGLSEFGTAELLGRLRLPAQSDDPALARKERFGWLFELHRRVAVSLAALIFAIVGVPLGMVNVRGGKGAGFSLSLIVLLAYWIVSSALGDLSLAGRLRPEVAAWAPALAVLAAGLWLLASKDRARGPAWIQRLLQLFPAREEGAPAAGRKASVRRSRGIAILDRYLLGRMLTFLFLIAASMLLLDWIIEVRGLSEFVTGAEKLKLLGRYLVNQTPGVLMILAPFAVLMTVLVTFGVLERTNEVLAMKASGVSLFRLTLPALALGLVAGLLLWAVGETLVPGATRRAQAQRDRIKNVASRNVPANLDVWLFAPDRQSLFHYNHYDDREDRFQGFSIYRLDGRRFRLESRFFAKRAVYEGARGLVFTNGWRWRSDAAVPVETLASGVEPVGVPMDYFVLPPLREGRFFNSADLRKLIRDLRARGYPTYQQKVDYYRKYSDAASPLVLILIGLPFAFMTGRRGSLYGIGIAIALVIAFYALSAVFQSVGVMQWLDPALAAWAPSVLFALGGGYLMLNLRT